MTNEIAIVPGKFSFVATTPEQMQLAQKDMIRWCDERLEREKLELADLERTIAEVQKAGMKDHSWKRRLGLSRTKMTFYRKIKSALLAGYYIMPPLDHQLFAVRTKLNLPRGGFKNFNSDFEQKGERLPEGEGEWYSNWPGVNTHVFPEKDKATGNIVDKRYWRPEFWKDVDFPFKLVKPEVIAAVGKALQEKIFDSLGVLPKYKNPDPIVVGNIGIPGQRYSSLTFFVAWWMDLEKL